MATFVAATGITVAATLLVFTALLPRLVPLSLHERSRYADRTAEGLAYLAPAPRTTIAPVRAGAVTSSRAEPRNAAIPKRRDQRSTPREDSAAPLNESAVSRATVPTQNATADTGDRLSARAMSPLLLPNFSVGTETKWGAGLSGATTNGPVSGIAGMFPHRSQEAIDYDSALRTVRDGLAATLSGRHAKGKSLEQTERDAQLRADALADIAARGAGTPIARAIAGGGHIDAPVPFGGPSRKQRERDSTINAQTKETLARIQRRLDSASVTRQRRHTDSLAHVEDSSRTNTRPMN